jgi:putative DNA primase/helicase
MILATSTIENRTDELFAFFGKIRPKSHSSRPPEQPVTDGSMNLRLDDMSEFAKDMAAGVTGDRHHVLVAVAGVLFKADWSDSAIETVITEICLNFGKLDSTFDVQSRIKKAMTFLLRAKAGIQSGRRERSKIAGWNHLKQHVDSVVVARWERRAGFKSWKGSKVHTESSLPPCYELREDGLYFVPFVPPPKEGEEPREMGKDDVPVWLCDKLEVVAWSRTSDHTEWGKLLVWHDPSGHKHQWAMPTSLTAGEGKEIRENLMAGGLTISPSLGARNKLLAYIVRANPTTKIRAVTQTGWYENCFVLPFETIGKAKDGESVVLQTPAQASSEIYAAKGTLFNWKARVSMRCWGNSRLTLALSAAFAGPLLQLLNEPNGGFHFRGPTSTGKSTALAVAASVWGSPQFRGSWRTTSNGLESVAALHNDSLLLMDEIDEAEGKDLGGMVYMLVNGLGRQRMTKNITARKSLSWHLMYLSSGETSIEAHMATGGKKMKGGQAVRCLDIPADAQKGMGIFEDIHGSATPASFADSFILSCTQDYGVAGRHFVNYVSENKFTVIAAAQRLLLKYNAEMKPPADASPEVGRACKKFAFLAMAGEIAVLAGSSEVPQGASYTAAKVCYQAWQDERGGTGSSDTDKGISQVRRFIEAHGSSRFQDLAESLDNRIFNRAGFKQKIGKEWHYHILPETFHQEVCLGFDPKAVAKAMKTVGMLETTRGHQDRISPVGMGRINIYHVTSKIFAQTTEPKKQTATLII